MKRGETSTDDAMLRQLHADGDGQVPRSAIAAGLTTAELRRKTFGPSGSPGVYIRQSERYCRKCAKVVAKDYDCGAEACKASGWASGEPLY